MGEKKSDGPELQLIRGGHHFEMSLGSIRIVAAPKDSPPFQVDAVAAEEDTFIVLSADPVVREPKEHPIRLMTRVSERITDAGICEKCGVFDRAEFAC